MSNRLRNVIAAIVLVGWAAGLVVPMVSGIPLDPVYVNTLNGAFMAIVGVAAMSYSHNRPNPEGQTESRRTDETGQSNEETTV